MNRSTIALMIFVSLRIVFISNHSSVSNIVANTSHMVSRPNTSPLLSTEAMWGKRLSFVLSPSKNVVLIVALLITVGSSFPEKSVVNVMRLLKTMRTIVYVSIIGLVVLFLIIKSKYAPQLKETTQSPSESYLTDRSFREELINERLKSHSNVYDKTEIGCLTNRSLSADEQINFDEISQSLIELRGEMVPYPQNHFHGQGIVLTVGLVQMTYLRVNLKMMELTRTRLPVQVIEDKQRYFDPTIV